MAYQRLIFNSGAQAHLTLTINDTSTVQLDMEPDWGDAAIEAELAELPRGALVGQRRLPPREIELGLRIQATTAGDLLVACQNVAAVVGEWQERGGTIQRAVVFNDATESEALTLTVLTAELRHDDEWMLAHRLSATCVLRATCDPVWLAPEREVASTLNSTSAVISTAIASAKGDVPGPLRVLIEDDATQGRKFVELALESEAAGNYDSASPAVVFLNSEDGTTGPNVTTEADTAAFDGDALELDPLFTFWREIVSETALTGKGGRRFRGRFKNTCLDHEVYARVAFSIDGGLWQYLPSVKVPVASPAAYFDVNLGQAFIPRDATTWQLRVEVSADATTPTAEGVRFDYLTIAPTELYVVARGGVTSPGGGTLLAFDDFEGIVDGSALAGRTPPAGTGNWAEAGDPTPDWLGYFDGVRRAIGTAYDTDANSGQYALLGTTVQAATTIEGDLVLQSKRDAASMEARVGFFARYVDTSNWLLVVLRHFHGGSNWQQVALYKRVAGTVTKLASWNSAKPLNVPDQSPLYTEGRLLLTVDAAGNYSVGVGARFGVITKTVIQGTDAVLATAAALDDGRFGLYHADTGSKNGFGYGYSNDVLVYSTVGVATDVWAVQSNGGLEIDVDEAVSYGTSPTVDRRPLLSHQGSDLYLPPGDSRGHVKARRGDSQEDADTGLADQTDVLYKHRPAFLHLSHATGEAGYRAFVKSLTPSLYWALDDDTLALDQSGNSRNGTGAGGITVGGNATAPITGETHSTDFDGTDDYISSTYNPFVNGTVRSFTGWAKLDGTTNYHALICGKPTNDGVDTTVLRIGFASSSVQFWSSGYTGEQENFAAWPTDSAWHHWVLVFDEPLDTCRWYVDGVLLNTTTHTAQYGAANTGFAVANGVANAFDGKQSHVAVFERGLTVAEIAELAKTTGPWGQ